MSSICVVNQILGKLDFFPWQRERRGGTQLRLPVLREMTASTGSTQSQSLIELTTMEGMAAHRQRNQPSLRSKAVLGTGSFMTWAVVSPSTGHIRKQAIGSYVNQKMGHLTPR
jgi:hypothetical protein